MRVNPVSSRREPETAPRPRRAARRRSPVLRDRPAAIRSGRGLRVERSISIVRPAAELFAFWRRFRNLPRFMRHVLAVKDLGRGRSLWRVRSPVGRDLEWRAEVINEVDGRLIAWRSLPGADVASAGSVHFDPLTGGRGTRVSVVLRYDPPAGRLGAAASRLLGRDPEAELREDLRRFRQLMEAGEIAVARVAPAPAGKTLAERARALR